MTVNFMGMFIALNWFAKLVYAYKNYLKNYTVVIACLLACLNHSSATTTLLSRQNTIPSRKYYLHLFTLLSLHTFRSLHHTLLCSTQYLKLM